MGRPKAYDDALRIRLVEAAAQLLADEGVGAVTTRRVAAAVGTSTTAIYSLIGSKDELLREMHREGFQRLADHLAKVDRTDDPLADLSELGAAIPRHGGREPPPLQRHVRGVVAELRTRRRRSPARGGTLQVLVDAVARAVDAGLLEGDPTDLALELWSYNHGLTSLRPHRHARLTRRGPPAPGQRLAGVAGRPRPRRGQR